MADTPQKDDAAWSQLDPNVHARLLEALRAVVTVGTARSLKGLQQLTEAACANDETFALFAKTGTPQLEESGPAPAELIFQQMAGAGLFWKDDETGLVYYTRKQAQLPVESEDLPELKARTVQDGEVRVDYAQYFQNPTQEVQASARFCGKRLNASELWDEVMEGIITANNQKVHRIERTVLGAGKALHSDQMCDPPPQPGHAAFGKHFAFVAAVYGREALRPGQEWNCRAPNPPLDYSQPRAAVAGVVAYTDKQVKVTTPAAAIEAGSELLLGPVAERLKLKIVDEPSKRIEKVRKQRARR